MDSKKSQLNFFLKRILHKIPYIKNLKNEVNNLKSQSYYPPGHFYSPIVSWEEVKHLDLWQEKKPETILDIDLNVEEQLNLLQSFKNYYSEVPWQSGQQPGLRYFFENDYYSYTDGIFLYSILRTFNPQRIIEVGSGFSSALMMDINELFFADKIYLTFIEPFPERLFSLIPSTNSKNVKILERKVQEVSTTIYDTLKEGDILFIDSSHVSKAGSDVNYILFQILPRLNKGVLIHFHDIFYPFEYPKLWISQGRNWNEIYLLRSFLMGNKNYKILLFSDYLGKCQMEHLEQMPLLRKNHGGNLWLEKIA